MHDQQLQLTLYRFIDCAVTWELTLNVWKPWPVLFIDYSNKVSNKTTTTLTMLTIVSTTTSQSNTKYSMDIHCLQGMNPKFLVSF